MSNTTTMITNSHYDRMVRERNKLKKRVRELEETIRRMSDFCHRRLNEEGEDMDLAFIARNLDEECGTD